MTPAVALRRCAHRVTALSPNLLVLSGPMPASYLSALFRYAKSSNKEALENFTTEVLAKAVRHDPSPLLSVLREAGVVAAAHGAPVRVLPQVHIAGVGIIDLVLVFESIEVWVEVKVHAPLSGNQIDRYLAYIASAPCETRLTTLAKKRFRADVTALRWQQLWYVVGETRPASQYWDDLRTYLEEIGMADAFDEPISDTEHAALAPAHRLMHKVARILVPFVESAASLESGLPWSRGEKAILEELGKKLRDHGVMSLSTPTKLCAGISVGIYADDAGLGIGTWVWTIARAVAARRKLLREAARRKLPAHWERSVSGWETLGRYAPLRDFRDHEAASIWLIGSLRELEEAGVPGLIQRLGLKSPENGEDDSEDGE